MTGLDVARCQNLLNSWMVYPDKVLWVDGMFGHLTDEAVRNFQRRVRIQVDGIVGPQTWAMLEA
jgi:peptidoglycan hydrolase-like protein with peptidoglycan-binding domain